MSIEEEMPRVDVIISCYNHEKYVEEALMSVLNQSYSNLRLLILDDGSSDRSRDVIEDVIGRYSGEKEICYYPETENTGFMAYDKMKGRLEGKYVATFSADDIMFPEKIAKQVAYMEEHAECLCCFTYAEGCGTDMGKKPFEEWVNRPSLPRAEYLRSFLMDGNRVSAPTALARTETYQKLGGLDFVYRQVHDYDLWMRILLEGEIYVYPEILLAYRMHGGNLTHADHGTNKLLMQEFFCLYYGIFKEMDATLFDEAFGEGVLSKDEADLLCNKTCFLLSCNNTTMKQVGVQFYYENHHLPDYVEKLTARGYTRKGMWEIARDSSIWGIAWEREYQNGILRQQIATSTNEQDGDMWEVDVEATNRIIDRLDNGMAGDVAWEDITDAEFGAFLRICRKLDNGRVLFAQTIGKLVG